MGEANNRRTFVEALDHLDFKSLHVIYHSPLTHVSISNLGLIFSFKSIPEQENRKGYLLVSVHNRTCISARVIYSVMLTSPLGLVSLPWGLVKVLTNLI